MMEFIESPIGMGTLVAERTRKLNLTKEALTKTGSRQSSEGGKSRRLGCKRGQLIKIPISYELSVGFGRLFFNSEFNILKEITVQGLTS